jgi:hypothetical protein
MISAGQPRWRLNEKTVPTIAVQSGNHCGSVPLPFAGMSTMTRTAARPEPDPRSKR